VGQWKRYRAGLKSYGKALLHKKIRYLILHVNSVCNAKCRMCFNWDGMMARRNEKAHTVEELTKLARSLEVLPQLTLSGGEPFLRKDIALILQTFCENAATRFFTIPTNSLLPDRVEETIRAFVKNCPDAFLNFCLPFHGTEEHFDDIMGVPGNYQKFLKTYEVIRKARESSPNVSCVLNFVMSKFNYQHYRSIIDKAAREFPEVPIGIAYARGITHERDAVDVPVQIYREANVYLLKQKRPKATFNPYSLIFDAIAEQICVTVSRVAEGTLQDLDCRAGRNFIVVYDNGAVYPCELLDVVGIPKGEGAPTNPCLGNLHDFDYDLSALLKTPEARRLIEWLDTHDCACTWECAAYSRTVNRPGEAARLLGRIGKNVLGANKGRNGAVPEENKHSPE